MHILIVSNVPPFQTGGAEVQAMRLAEQFLFAGHKVTVVGHRIPTGQLPLAEERTLELRRIWCRGSSALFRAVTFAISLVWVAIREKDNYDVIYCRFITEAAIVLSLAKRCGLVSAPLVVCPACAGPGGDAQWLLRLPFSRALVSTLNHSCDAINIISQEIANELKSIGIQERMMTYIPNGVELAGARKADFADSGSRRFVFVGRLAPQKGLTYLLRAMLATNSDYPGTTLTVIGDGPERDALEREAAELGIGDAVNFSGQMSNAEVRNQLRNHDVFVLPSLYEGLPNALLEAMACGLPVIVTRCGGPEFVVDSSMSEICDPGNVQALTRAMVTFQCMSGAMIDEMGANSYRAIATRYCIEQTAAAYLDLFKRVANRRH